MQDDLNRLIDELLTRELRPNTREDLGEFRQQLAAGTLAADDAKYIRALHARVVAGGVPKAEKPPSDSAPPGEIARLQAELAGLRAERDQLQKTVAELRQEIDALKRESAKG